MANTGRVLTPKGAATRDRIVSAAADLFYEHGVSETGNEDIRREARVSGSQLNHYFTNREELVRAVLDRRAMAAADPGPVAGLGRPATLDAVQEWADDYVRDWTDRLGGCRVGSLAAETLKSGFSLDDDVAAAFERWRSTLEEGLLALRDHGALRPEADVARLSLVLLAALQGGLLLTQVTRDPAALRASLDAAVETVRREAQEDPGS
ncbi:TetR/AcrR family transcriptional regulator [Amnibacterium kyonggiense]